MREQRAGPGAHRAEERQQVQKLLDQVKELGERADTWPPAETPQPCARNLRPQHGGPTAGAVRKLNPAQAAHAQQFYDGHQHRVAQIAALLGVARTTGVRGTSTGPAPRAPALFRSGVRCPV